MSRAVRELTLWDRVNLEEGASLGVEMVIKHYGDLKRIAERFNNGSINLALKDAIEKGLQDLLDLCDMDDKLYGIDEAMMDSAPSTMPNTQCTKGGST